MGKTAADGLKKDIIWNTLGSLIYALSSMVLAFIALRFAGPDDGGIFGFGFSTLGQQMFIVAYFGIRPFHITDTKREYTYGDYRRLRLYTAGLAIVIAALYLAVSMLLGHYDLRKASILILLVAYKVCDGIADLYESECQRIDRLYIGGMELSARTILASAALAITVIVTGNVMLAAGAGVIMQLISILFFRQYLNGRLLKEAGYAEEASGGNERIKSLVKDTVLIFLSVFIDFYIFSATKYSVDRFMTDADNGIFNILFMPTSVIYLAANFIIKPYMSRLARVWDEREFDRFDKARRILLAYIAIISVIAVLIANFFGTPILKLLEMLLGTEYEGMLVSRHYEFVLLIIGGCFYAITNLYYYILVIMRRQQLIFMDYLIMAIGVFVISRRAVTGYGMTGAAAAYAAYMLLLMIVFASTVKKGMTAEKEQTGNTPGGPENIYDKKF